MPAHQSGWALPIDLILYFAELLVPEEPYQDSPDGFESPDFFQNHRTLRQLTYLCRATRELLEPFTFRFVLLEDGADITHYFLLLAQNPRIRPFVRHVVCLSSMDWSRTGDVSIPRSHAVKLWEARCPGMSVDQVMRQAGFTLDCHEITEGHTRILYADFAWADVVKFLFGSVLLMVPSIETLSFHHSHTDDDSYATNIVAGIMRDASERGHPVMNKLRVLKLSTGEDEILSEAAELFFFRTRQWENLRTLVLDDIDFDDEFGQLVLEKCFPEELPIEELYVRGYRTGGLFGDPTLNDDNFHFKLESIFQYLGYSVITEPTFKVFKNLRLLDVVFPPSTRRNIHGSTVLRLFLEGIGGAPETLRLAQHPFPSAALGRTTHERLKNLAIKGCVDMPENPSHEEMAEKAFTLHHGDHYELCLPNLKSMMINGAEHRPESQDRDAWIQALRRKAQPLHTV